MREKSEASTVTWEVLAWSLRGSIERTKFKQWQTESEHTMGESCLVLGTPQGQKAHIRKRTEGQTKGFHQMLHSQYLIRWSLFWAFIFLSPELAQMEACLDENPDFFMVSSTQLQPFPLTSSDWPGLPDLMRRITWSYALDYLILCAGLPDAKRKPSNDRQVVDRACKSSPRRHWLLFHKSNQVHLFILTLEIED